MDRTPAVSVERNHESKSNRVLVAVCTLNESENIVELITAIRHALPLADVLVVDDQSPDGTGQLVNQLSRQDEKITLSVRKNQKGLGGAIRSAMQHAVDHGYEFFINLDGDFSHDPKQLPSLLRLATATDDFDVVIGSRYAAGGAIVGWPTHRKWMSRLINRFAITALGLPVSDCSGSMRCYRVNALERVGLQNLRVNGYAVLEEILLKLVQQGSRLAEVPITFTDRQRGKSKLTVGEAMRSCSQMIRMSLQRG